ncbi:MAG: DNA polymerase III subunit gamma/tau [Acidobacteria bacterium]|nr:MAG: DNA polymerase III subunit gamma/tau [Acidobacteriota bacterium]
MPYQVIARKWRPQTFEDVVGQEAITRTLQNAIADERLHHAYIFAGPRGVGKTTTARIFARALNCAQGPTIKPCGACAACQEIAEGRSIDVLEIDAATHTQVDNVREVIINTIGMTPARDRYKIFIIDEVHQLSSHAFNALLKTLEEPPPHVLFIMATTERHKVPETILSRCQIFEFRLIPEQHIFARLRHIAEEEGIMITEAALHKIARAGEGSMRDAQSIFDQVISFAGRQISDEDVVTALGLVGTDVLVEVTEAIADGDSRRILHLVGGLVDRGYDLRYFCRELMTHFRNLLILKSVGYDSELLSLSSAELESIRELPQRFSEGELIRAFHSLTEMEQDLRYAGDPRFHLEIGLIKLAQAEKLRPIAELIDRLEALEKRLGEQRATPVAQATTPSSTTHSDTENASPRLTSARSPGEGPARNPSREKASANPSEQAATGVAPAPIADERAIVEQMKAALDERGKMLLSTALDQAQSVELDGDALRIVFTEDARVFKETLTGRSNLQLLQHIARQISGREIRLHIVVEKAAAPTVHREDLRLDHLRAEAERDPTVRALLKTFRGELTDVVQKNSSEDT